MHFAEILSKRAPELDQELRVFAVQRPARNLCTSLKYYLRGWPDTALYYAKIKVNFKTLKSFKRNLVRSIPAFFQPQSLRTLPKYYLWGWLEKHLHFTY